MDFGELGQDVDEEVSFRPARFSLPRIRPFAGLRPRRVQRRLAQQGRILRAMTLPVSRLVFVAGYVQYQCSQFSIPQWPRTMPLRRSGGRGRRGAGTRRPARRRRRGGRRLRRAAAPQIPPPPANLSNWRRCLARRKTICQARQAAETPVATPVPACLAPHSSSNWKRKRPRALQIFRDSPRHPR